MIRPRKTDREARDPRKNASIAAAGPEKALEIYAALPICEEFDAGAVHASLRARREER